jgi:hypothetical protein
MEELLRLGLIPAEDGKLRAAAIGDYVADERDNNTPGGAPDPGMVTERRKGLSHIGALTPGGIAWKIATVLGFWHGEETWEWWRYPLYSALIDAAELERAELPHRVSRRRRPIDRPRRWAHAATAGLMIIFPNNSAPPSPAGLLLVAGCGASGINSFSLAR